MIYVLLGRYNEDPLGSDWISYEDLDQEYVKVEFSAPMPPNKPEEEAPISNDSSISEYCRFARVVHCMSQLDGFDVDFDLGVEQVDGSPSDGPRERFVSYANDALWHQVMKIKDLQQELLR